MNFFQSVVIAIVEGITEFLPISSTGHMIITERVLGVQETDFVKVFTVAIQLGAILAVVVLYAKKFFDFSRWHFYAKLIIGVIPAIVIGLLFAKKIDAMLESTLVVVYALVIGGIILLFIDKLFTTHTIHSEKEISPANAFIIGIWQCLAMIPGMSRSAASIIGGMQQKLTRSEAAEFSFFLAVPTMLAASGYKMYKYYKEAGGFSGEEIKMLAVGNIAAFLVALLAIKFFISFVKKYGFKIWGVYRITVGLILLLLIYKGYL